MAFAPLDMIRQQIAGPAQRPAAPAAAAGPTAALPRSATTVPGGAGYQAQRNALKPKDKPAGPVTGQQAAYGPQQPVYGPQLPVPGPPAATQAVQNSNRPQLGAKSGGKAAPKQDSPLGNAGQSAYGLLQDTVGAGEKVAGAQAFRGYDLLSGARDVNASGTFRGMTKDASAGNVSEGLGYLGMALNLPETISEAGKAFPEVEATSNRKDLGPIGKTAHQMGSIIDHGSQAGFDLMGLGQSFHDVKDATAKAANSDNVLDFGATIFKGGAKTVLDAVPFCGGLANMIKL